jgi:D-3-phosphoglycerate dehydrogenase
MSIHPVGRILVTPRSLTQAGLENVPELNPLREAGFELLAPIAGRVPSVDDLLGLVPFCVGWLAGVEQITEPVLKAASHMQVISRNGTGTDAIDLDAASAAGIRVERAAGSNAQGVAELALTLTLSCLRNEPWSSRTVREGRWQRWQGRELADTTIGVVGLGAIGRKVAGMFQGLGSTVIGFDPFVSDAVCEIVQLDELTERSNVVTLHAPPPDDGSALFDKARLALARPGSILINTARASLVDDDSVLEALNDGRLAAYAVDAFETEPPELTPLLLHERVLATPHLGGYTGGSVSRATSQAVENLLRWLPATVTSKGI